MIKLTDINKDIKFFDKEHKYFLGEKELTSVSALISLYKPIFDEQGHIKRAVAKRDGLSVNEVSENWEKAKQDGLKRGKSFHRQVEHYIKTGEILEDDYKDVITCFKNNFKFKGKLVCEIPLHHPKYLIAGTCDLLEILDNRTLNLYDWKSNKEINLKSKYKKKLLYPLEHLDECEGSNYGIQLNLYKFMLEYHGYNIKKITLYHINPETRKIDSYNMPDMQKEVKDLLEHYKSINSF